MGFSLTVVNVSSPFFSGPALVTGWAITETAESAINAEVKNFLMIYMSFIFVTSGKFMKLKPKYQSLFCPGAINM